MKKEDVDAGKALMSNHKENYFKRFKLNISFDVDINSLEESYFRLQQDFHPDRMFGKSDAERLSALQKSMDVNHEYECLKDPLSRSEYLLSIQEIIVNKDGQGVKPSQELLIESLESREKLEQADKNALTQLEADTKFDIDQTVLKLKELFENNEYEIAAQQTIRLKYLYKLLQEIRHKKGK